MISSSQTTETLIMDSMSFFNK
uniref:Uncharacterized protein n=1 Tax=Rhizophora mucronata TaxID=61149 RepID=A0A2P2NR45_RHIMU